MSSTETQQQPQADNHVDHIKSDISVDNSFIASDHADNDVDDIIHDIRNNMSVTPLTRIAHDNKHEHIHDRVRVTDHFAITSEKVEDKCVDDDMPVEKDNAKSLSESKTVDDNEQQTDNRLGRKEFFDVRVAVLGNVDSGKSTLIGVLTGGILDNGRGLARSRVFLHHHEHETGRTSSISQHILGYDSAGAPVYQPVAANAASQQKTKSWQHVISHSKSLVTFVDLCGHEKYLKTTVAGLTGSFPDFALVIVNSLAGITKMTKEHLGVILALDVPLICCVSKIDLVPENVLGRTKDQLFKILKSPAAKKMPVQIRSQKDVDMVLDNLSSRICPVFFISSVTGTHINLLTNFLSKLRPRQTGTVYGEPSDPLEFSIDDTFNVTGVGVVASGTIMSGTIKPNTTLLLGPTTTNTWIEVLVRTLHCKRVAVDIVEAGASCAISLRAVKRKETLKRSQIRRGMVLVDPAVNPVASRWFEAEVAILHHPTTIKLGYQAVIHLGMVRQTAQLTSIHSISRIHPTAPTPDASSADGAAPANKDFLRTGDKALTRFRFLLREEYIHKGATFVFREGSTKGIGKVVRVQSDFSADELSAIENEEVLNRRQLARQHRQATHAHSHVIHNSNTQATPAHSSASVSAAAAAASSVFDDNATGIDKRTSMKTTNTSSTNSHTHHTHNKDNTHSHSSASHTTQSQSHTHVTKDKRTHK